MAEKWRWVLTRQDARERTSGEAGAEIMARLVCIMQAGEVLSYQMLLSFPTIGSHFEGDFRSAAHRRHQQDSIIPIHARFESHVVTIPMKVGWVL